MKDELTNDCPETRDDSAEELAHKPTLRDRVKEGFDRAKNFVSDHKGQFIVGGIAFIGGLALSLLGSRDDSSAEDALSDEDCDDEPAYPENAKYWNKEQERWEMNGEPYTYRVTYIDVRDGEKHVRDFTDIDNGYEVYEDLDDTWWAKEVQWDHIPPE